MAYNKSLLSYDPECQKIIVKNSFPPFPLSSEIVSETVPSLVSESPGFEILANGTLSRSSSSVCGAIDKKNSDTCTV